MRWYHKLLVIVGVIVLVAGFGPFLISPTMTSGTKSGPELADAGSQFITINQVSVHYHDMGQGDCTLILLHGFGASTFSWREVDQQLGETCRVVSYDRPGFGLTSRPLPGDWSGKSPYDMDQQVDLLIGLMDSLQIDTAILVGNSAGGTVAVNVALMYPERVEGLVLVDPAISSIRTTAGWLQWLMHSPLLARLGPIFVRSIQTRGDDFIRTAWHDPEKVTEDILEGYREPLMVKYWEQGLWQFTIADKGQDLPSQLINLDLPVMIITGDDDRIVPTEQSVRLAGEIQGATLVVVPNCGHLPQEECPDVFMNAVTQFLGEWRIK